MTQNISHIHQVSMKSSEQTNLVGKQQLNDVRRFVFKGVGKGELPVPERNI